MSFYYQLVNTSILNMRQDLRASLVALVVKGLPAKSGVKRDVISIPGREEPLEERMAPHASIFARRVPRTEEPGGLSPRGRAESHTTV